jgi:hypothetical protein
LVDATSAIVASVLMPLSATSGRAPSSSNAPSRLRCHVPQIRSRTIASRRKDTSSVLWPAHLAVWTCHVVMTRVVVGNEEPHPLVEDGSPRFE